MDLAFSPDQEALAALARDVFAGHVTPDRLKEVEAADPDRFDRTLWSELARGNLLGAGIADEHGGIGGGILEVCLLLEQAGAVVAPVPLLPTLAIGALPVQRYGSNDIKASLLPRVASGEAILTAALIEPADDPFKPKTAAAWEGDAWRLEGLKSSVPAAHIAERVLVPATTENGTGVFLLDPRAGGVVAERQRGTSGEFLTRLELDGAAVPEAEVLVEPGTDPEALPWMLNVAFTSMCAMQVGLAERALKLTAEYLSQREQFGKPLATFQAVQLRAADCYIDVESMRWTMWQAAWRMSEDLPAADEVAIAKFWAADGGHRVLAAAQHLHGGIGVDVDYPLHRYTIASKQLEMTLGGATQHLARLGDLMAEAR